MKLIININMHGHGKKRLKDNYSKTLLLVGNPNVGKSVIFGILTGKYVTVSNYPGTTVEVTQGAAVVHGERYGVIDTPGVNSLVPQSDDERVTRDILLNQKADAIVQVCDAKNMRRSLLIALQIAEAGLSFSIALNMSDEARARGIEIDHKRLIGILGIDVIPTIATQKKGIDIILKGVPHQVKSHFSFSYRQSIENGIKEIEKFLPDANISKRSIAIMLLSGDETLDTWLGKNLSEEIATRIEEIRSGIQSKFTEPLNYIINIERLKVVDGILAEVVSSEAGAKKGSFAAFLSMVSMHPVWGIPVLFAVLYLMYKFVGEFGAGASVNFFEKVIFGEYLNPWATRVITTLVPVRIVQDLLVGPYGMITMALTYAIAIILPIVGYFFLFFGILEDSGYLPRLAVMVDKVFKIMGLNGKAVLPMVLGLGCDTMATMTARILETKKDRIIVTLLLALGVPCSAQLGVILGMLGALSFKATIVWGGVVVFVMLFVGFLASRIITGEPSDFLLEIPPIRLPQIKNIIVKTLVRIEWYLKEAVPLFILGTFVLFLMDKLKLLKVIEHITSPVIETFLGLPAKATEAFIVGFLRRDYGAAGLLAMQKNGLLEPTQVVVSLITITLFIPCIANFLMIAKERGMKAAVWMSAFIFPFAIFVGGVVNFILRFFDVRF
ncbi:MAG: ferrous iron transport protein B [Deltaproteobacteria bacterium]|nr:ferrous iron transport protein B [Deltaproteobacteria bacterium]